MRKIKFLKGEYYHIYNRGTDKRNIISDIYDLQRFFQAMDEFNTVEPIGSIYENSFLDDKIKNQRKKERLVNFIAYCINPNHYHFILEQLTDNGISDFMKKLGGGHACYYNNKYQRTGGLFQGPFKAAHISSNEYLLYLCVYVNLNNKVHQLGDLVAKLTKSSWEEYIWKSKENFCVKDVVLNQFKNKQEYKEFAEDTIRIILANKKPEDEFKNILLE